MKKKFFWNWLTDHFNYRQCYILICTLFLLASIPIAYYWAQERFKQINNLDRQLTQIHYQSFLKKLFGQIQFHQLLISQAGSINQKELGESQEIIQGSFQELINQYNHTVSNSTSFNYVWRYLNPIHLQNQWENLKQTPFHLEKERVDFFYTALIQSFNNNLSYLNSQIIPFRGDDVETGSFMQNILLILPLLQENLYKLILLGEDIVDKQPISSSTRNEIFQMIRSVESDVVYLQRQSEAIFLNLSSNEDKNLFNLINNYSQASTDLMDLIQNYLVVPFIKNNLLFESQELSRGSNRSLFLINGIKEDLAPLNISQILAEGRQALSQGSLLWDWSLESLQQIIFREKDFLVKQTWLILFLTFGLTALAFYLGLGLTYRAAVRLSHLTQATDNFTNGNISVRVPVDYSDEIGKQAQAFNRMAQKLGESVHNLYEWIDATTTLAKGDLTVRIPLKNNHSELDQAALSFNKMAETFEIVIGRLKHLEVMLTTSATEISAASKEQETIIIEQEATTREIAVAANEISSTAKEFANTVNEINLVAEKTSNLALTSKDSLANMESIMSLMVEASSNIASKLSILNEKAGYITSVITAITKVADQTNLLSLNASIEAEKAGEYGRSFSVIAREIRRLADQTAVATLDIEKIVNEIMTAISSSVMGVDDFTQEIRLGVDQVKTVSGQLAKIIEQVQAFTDRFEIVNQGMQAQSKGAEQINEAITQLSQTAQQTSESIHQFHKTIQELNKAANELHCIVHR